MAEKRLRKRSVRQCKADPTPFEEPPPKKLRRQRHTSPVTGRGKASSKAKKEKNSNLLESQSSPPDAVGAVKQGYRKGKQLLVSLNIQDHDLQVPGKAGSDVGVIGVKGAARGKRKGRSRPVSQQRDQSVVSDGGSSNSNGGNGRTLTFKNPNFTFSSAGPNKKKVWKSLKQMLAVEKSSGLGPNVPTYGSIDAPPSFKPAKKYSDLSGLIAKYTDPLTGLYFSSAEEFQILRTLPQDVVQGYLALRGKMTIT